MPELNEKIAALSPEKRALLEARLLKTTPPPCAQPLVHTPTELELSPSQLSLWFLDQLEPNSSFYTIPQAMRISGPLNVSALRKAFDTITSRHQVLQTQITVVGEKPRPRLSANVMFELPLIDLSRLGHSEKNIEANRLIDIEAHKPFDLANDLMLRASLLRFSEIEHILLLTVHHIACDHWSFFILYRELETCYSAYSKDSHPDLPALNLQFSDFACAQRKFLQSPEFQKQLDYWKQQLSENLPELELPLDHLPPPQQNFRGARKMISIPSDLARDLKLLSQREGTTPYVLLLTAFEILLHRVSGQTQIVLGSPLGGRSAIATEQLIGYFVNPIVLRLDLAGDIAFRDALHRSRDVVLGAFANQEIPFDRLVDELRVPRSAGKNPIFQTMFQFQSTTPQLQLPGTSIELLKSENSTSKLNLIFTLEDSDTGMNGHLEYNTSLFNGETIERMLGMYKNLLRSIVTDPAEKISRLNLLNETEKKQLVVDWNQTRTDYPQKCIQQLFEEQVQQSPDAIALVFGTAQLTYKELNERANQLAHHLRQCGVGPDVPVGLCLERSFELIISLLAILKAGGAYVPLDSSFPAERLQFMVQDTAVTILITDQKFAFFNGRIINPKTLMQQSSEELSCITTPENLAYVLYTSGSTGKPKGVAVPHRAVVRLVRDTNFMRFSSSDVFLQFAPVSFDASTLEIWGSLLNGAQLVIHPPHLPSLQELGATLQRHHVTTLWLTAGLFHQMVEHQIEDLRGVKQLLAGGDVLSVAHVQKVLKHLDCRLINGYGPTENTTFACCYTIPKGWKDKRSVPIGKPISNTQVYILDSNLQPAPVGVPGELFIGGDGLARGYLNRPELNSEKFIRNPFQPAQCLYKTGDKARYLADGNIEFLGRMDNQVKLRGFRIELGEIEAALGEHPLIQQRVVLTLNNSTGEKSLVAYITTKPGTALTDGELRIFLEHKLPSYMVPSHFVSLETFPLTANGKIDRHKLPAPEDSVSISSNLVAPRNDTEQKLFNIWKQILGRENFGVHENFFQLGGHSLLATRVGSRIAQQFEIQFSLNLIFLHPTIARLSLALENAPREISRRKPQLVRRGARTETQTIPLGAPFHEKNVGELVFNPSE